MNERIYKIVLVFGIPEKLVGKLKCVSGAL
jgi:hypothetical protein